MMQTIRETESKRQKAVNTANRGAKL